MRVRWRFERKKRIHFLQEEECQQTENVFEFSFLKSNVRSTGHACDLHRKESLAVWNRITK